MHRGITCAGSSALLLLVALAPALANARCTDPGDLKDLGQLLQDDLTCHFGQLVVAGPPCPTPNYPACAESTPAQVKDLVLGPAAGPVTGWTPKALRCQRDIAAASSRFVSRRLVERSQGKRRAKSGRAMRRVAKTCSKAVVEENYLGQELVRVGAPCANVVGALGGPVDGARVAACLRATLEAEMDDVAPGTMPPNVVLIVTDDQQYDTFDLMPAVSKLRDEAISFPNAFVTNPLCTPSRATILTGLYSHNTGVLANHQYHQLDPSTTIAAWLDAAGYTNGLFGKYVNNSELLGLAPPQGWHEWKSLLDPSGGEFYGARINDNGTAKTLPQGTYSTDWMSKEAIRFMRREADTPFLLVYTPFAPHAPAIPANRHAADPPSYPVHRPPSYFADVATKPQWVRFFRFIAAPALPGIIDTLRLQQLRTLRAVDEAVEKLLVQLEKLGLTDNTVVIFTSDHGFMWGEHGLVGKFNPYEESIRVPYLLRYPRRFPLPATRNQMVLNQDIAPTLAEFAGIATPPLDGESLVPLLESATAPWRDEFLIETRGEFITQPSESVRTENFKYIETAGAGPHTELYDLAADPYEITNLAGHPTYAGVQANMVARLGALRP
ncbi:MAG: sulfatase-like hydrolase/transferase [Candidatus Binatia bacterium]|nr:sulfatase-like hydrolase/transferase [Candidatus Binatia bacterium]